MNRHTHVACPYCEMLIDKLEKDLEKCERIFPLLKNFMHYDKFGPVSERDEAWVELALAWQAEMKAESEGIS